MYLMYFLNCLATLSRNPLVSHSVQLSWEALPSGTWCTLQRLQIEFHPVRNQNVRRKVIISLPGSGWNRSRENGDIAASVSPDGPEEGVYS